jgi:hypothetical protein
MTEHAQQVGIVTSEGDEKEIAGPNDAAKVKVVNSSIV